MSGYRISEVAERTGFSAPTLRYYEEIGLVRRPERTTAGYRLYDDRAIDRLRFIARSKRLGLTLDEITGLVELWDAEECAPVQERLRDLLVAKQHAATAHIRELDGFVRHFLLRKLALAGQCLDRVAIAIARREIHLAVNTGWLVLESVVNQAESFHKLLPIDRTQQAQTGDTVTDGDLIRCLTLTLLLHELLYGKSVLDDPLFEPATRQMQGRI